MLEDFDFDSDLRQNPKWQVSSSHTDLPRLREGKIGGQVSARLFFIISKIIFSSSLLSFGLRTSVVKQIIKMQLKEHWSKLML